MLGSRTRGGRMEGADESTELWWHPNYYFCLGECICAPHVTGTDDNPCSECEENTFGYDPITGCQVGSNKEPDFLSKIFILGFSGNLGGLSYSSLPTIA